MHAPIIHIIVGYVKKCLSQAKVFSEHLVAFAAGDAVSQRNANYKAAEKKQKMVKKVFTNEESCAILIKVIYD